jgi:Ca-activated chloride channel homolog
MLQHPAFLFLLTLIPLLGWRMWRRSDSRGVRFSSAIDGLSLSPTLRQRFSWLPNALLLLALTAMVIAMARPREGKEQTVIHSEGIAIEMVVDRSSSMMALDFRLNGQRVDRLSAIKNVAGRFVTGDTGSFADSTRTENTQEELPGRVSDLVGLISFAGYADAVTPPTLDHAFLTAQLDSLQIVADRREDGTAIGDAISLAVEKLSSMDASKKEKVKSKVIILLTDGDNTAGEVEPMQAAELAATLGIKIYAIGVGTKGSAPIPVRSPFTGRMEDRMMEVTINEPMLRNIAKTCDGRYFRATDTNSLEAIYREINKLEKTKVETEHYMDYRELAVQSVTLAGLRFPPVLVIAMCLLTTSFVLSRSVFRRFDL